MMNADVPSAISLTKAIPLSFKKMLLTNQTAESVGQLISIAPCTLMLTLAEPVGAYPGYSGLSRHNGSHNVVRFVIQDSLGAWSHAPTTIIWLRLPIEGHASHSSPSQS